MPAGAQIDGPNRRRHHENAPALGSRGDVVDRPIRIGLNRGGDAVLRHVALNVGRRPKPRDTARRRPLRVIRIAHREILPIERGGLIHEQHVVLVEELILAGDRRGSLLRAVDRVDRREAGRVDADGGVVGVHIGQHLGHVDRSVGRDGQRGIGLHQSQPPGPPAGLVKLLDQA